MDEERLELTRVWLIKAQHDLAAAKRLAQGNDPVLDVAIYHCQQAAEKALKGLLVYRNIPFEKIHDLKVLIGLALPVAPTLSGLIEKADQSDRLRHGVSLPRRTARTRRGRIQPGAGRR